MEKTIRDYIEPTESFLECSIGGLNFWLVWADSPDPPDTVPCKTYYKDYDGYIQAGFNVIPYNKATEFVIEKFQNSDGTDFHFEWYSADDESFSPCFAVYDKEACFDGDLVDGWAFADGQWTKCCQFSLRVDRLSDSIYFEKASSV